MKAIHSFTVTSNVVALLPLFICLLFVSNVRTSYSSDIDDFLQCLPSHSNHSHPISNAIYTPSNSSFLDVLRQYLRNSRFNTSSTPKPLAIVTALDVSHVQATVLCAKTNGIQIRIRSGGHDFEGLSYVSYVPFVVLDMFNLRSIDIDIQSETAWVEAGATVGELYYNIAQKSKVHAFPAGTCFTVGLGGHISGGGDGILIRQFGLAIDNVIDAQVVDARGRLLNRQSMGEDFFWAIRGGGGASFGVIISWKIKLVRVPELVTVFNVSRTLEQGAADVVLQWQQMASTTDKKLFIGIISQVGGSKTVQVSFIGLYLGRATDLLPLMNKSFPILGLQAQNCAEMPWIEATLFWYNNPRGTPLEVLLDRSTKPANSVKYKSDYVKKPIPRAGVEKIWNKMMEVESGSIFQMQWYPYGGRMSEISSDATAFPHRAGNLFILEYYAQWQDDSIEATNRNIQATRDIHATLTPYVSRNPREACMNDRDIDLGTNANGSLVFALDYFKDNVNRLLQVKTKVDPSNFFRYEQSIPVELRSSGFEDW